MSGYIGSILAFHWVTVQLNRRSIFWIHLVLSEVPRFYLVILELHKLIIHDAISQRTEKGKLSRVSGVKNRDDMLTESRSLFNVIFSSAKLLQPSWSSRGLHIASEMFKLDYPEYMNCKTRTFLTSAASPS